MSLRLGFEPLRPQALYFRPRNVARYCTAFGHSFNIPFLFLSLVPKRKLPVRCPKTFLFRNSITVVKKIPPPQLSQPFSLSSLVISHGFHTLVNPSTVSSAYRTSLFIRMRDVHWVRRFGLSLAWRQVR